SDDKSKAYKDKPLNINCSQTISQPYMVALMTQLLELKGNEKVLEIGTGSGYQAAILAELAAEVYSVDRHPALAKQAQTLLNELGYSNVHIKTGNGTLGLPEAAPFDGIIVTASAPEAPEALIEQLKDYGRMVIPIGSRDQQELTLIQKRGDSYISKAICGCIFVPLIGKQGWEK
ncbi:protein-L-isoaspartate(D-aspartate) O-methyltransferase, partial [candidate division KSB1 bacterium]|nr:protein-L-isoaspartate(D-aspartate) O-methyltransferase [candidate division KSB1 bacterium]